MSKVVKIRLYRVQDFDLFTIYYDKSFHFGQMVRDAVSAYANGRPLPMYSMRGIEPLPKPAGIEQKSGVKFTLTTSFSVPDTDKKTIALLDKLTDGNTLNAFVKTLMRRCMTDLQDLYFTDEEDRARFQDPYIRVAAVTETAAPASVPKKERRKQEENQPEKSAEQPVKEDVIEKEPEERDARPVQERAAEAAKQAQPEPEHEQAPKQEAQNEEQQKKQETPKEEQHKKHGVDLFSMVRGFEA